MLSETYYLIMVIIAVLGVLGKGGSWVIGSVITYFRDLKSTLNALKQTVDLITTNHLPHMEERLTRIETVLIEKGIHTSEAREDSSRYRD